MPEIRNKIAIQIIHKFAGAAKVSVLFHEGKIDLARASMAWEKLAEQLLSLPELAIVDRDAELPENYLVVSMGRDIRRIAQQDMVNEGWVKEVK